jgi:hypothetical protein
LLLESISSQSVHKVMGVHIKKLKMSINHRGLKLRVTWGMVQGFF